MKGIANESKCDFLPVHTVIVNVRRQRIENTSRVKVTSWPSVTSLWVAWCQDFQEQTVSSTPYIGVDQAHIVMKQYLAYWLDGVYRPLSRVSVIWDVHGNRELFGISMNRVYEFVEFGTTSCIRRWQIRSSYWGQYWPLARFVTWPHSLPSTVSILLTSPW